MFDIVLYVGMYLIFAMVFSHLTREMRDFWNACNVAEKAVFVAAWPIVIAAILAVNVLLWLTGYKP